MFLMEDSGLHLLSELHPVAFGLDDCQGMLKGRVKSLIAPVHLILLQGQHSLGGLTRGHPPLPLCSCRLIHSFAGLLLPRRMARPWLSCHCMQ